MQGCRAGRGRQLIWRPTAFAVLHFHNATAPTPLPARPLGQTGAGQGSSTWTLQRHARGNHNPPACTWRPSRGPTAPAAPAPSPAARPRCAPAAAAVGRRGSRPLPPETGVGGERRRTGGRFMQRQQAGTLATAPGHWQTAWYTHLREAAQQRAAEGTRALEQLLAEQQRQQPSLQ